MKSADSSVAGGQQSDGENSAGEQIGGKRFAGFLLCLLLLALLAWVMSRSLQLSGDLRLFMPAPRNDAQRLLIEQLGEGPGSRLLLLALHADEHAVGSDDDSRDLLAERSRALREALGDSDEFVWVSNGEEGLDAIPEQLLDYRYLLSAGPSQGSLQGVALAKALQQRLRDLSSPAATMIAPLIATDPTLETLTVVESWQPANEPERHDGVWMSAVGEALLVVETAAPGFDPSGQQQTLQVLRRLYLQLLADEAEITSSDNAGDASTKSEDDLAQVADISWQTARQLGLEVSGPGAFAERMAAETRAEASRYGSIAGIALFALLMLAYRSVWLPLIGALPLLVGALGALAITAAWFGAVHGITLAFGLTLLGVAQDYPVHLFSHRRPGEAASLAVRRIWPTLATGAFSSALAYLVFFFTGVEGLQQLAVLTVSGLALAALTTRFILSLLLPAATSRPLSFPGMNVIEALARRLRRWRQGAWALALGLLGALIIAPAPWWQDDLAALTPLPRELLQRDGELRRALAAPDVRWLLQLKADSAQQALRNSELLRPELDALVKQGAIAGYDLAARYLPSTERQRERQAALPGAEQLSADLAAASADLPFRADAFVPFLQAVERARQLPPLALADLAGSAMELRLAGLLVEQPDAASALIQLQAPRDFEALQQLAERHSNLQLLDLKQTANSLASAWRYQVLWAMAAAALLLWLMVALALRSPRRALRVMAPVALGTLSVLAVLHLAAVPLSLFHLVAFVLAAGLGLDYALFFERPEEDSTQARQTLHALLLCAASTLLVFGLLGLSEIPVLRALGVTVALGVLAHFSCSLWLLAAAASPERSEHAD